LTDCLGWFIAQCVYGIQMTVTFYLRPENQGFGFLKVFGRFSVQWRPDTKLQRRKRNNTGI